MLRSLNSAVSGMQQFQEEIDVIGNNIANVDTTGFKSSRVDFEDTLSQAIGAGSPSNQVGTGVTTAAISTNFNPGAPDNTGVTGDLALTGQGFFVVQNAATQAQFVTRAGDFHVENGYLVTTGGLRVQGYSDTGLSTVGDIKIDATGAPATADPNATVSSWSVGTDGKITVKLTDNTQFVRGQVLLQNYSNPEALVKEGGNLYSASSAAGPLAALSAPNTNGLGAIQSGALEMSNVDLTSEMANLITAQNAFQANARVITTSDQVLQEIINLKR
jgi:flagellar hook protein FlgE